MSSLYYESHITIDPVFGEELQHFKEVCLGFNFRVAKLLMEKTPSTQDAFCTSRSQVYTDIVERTSGLVLALKQVGFKVRRYKIEDTLVDSKIDDKFELLCLTHI